jgi:hypothetical protein
MPSHGSESALLVHSLSLRTSKSGNYLQAGVLGSTHERPKGRQ